MVSLDLARRTISQRSIFARARLADWGTFDQPPHVIAGWLQQHSGWTRSTYVGHFKSLYTFLLEEGHLAGPDPTRRLRRGPQPDPHSTPLSPVQRAQVLQQAEGRMRTWMVLGYYAGLRCHEIAKFHGRDVDELHLRVVGKGKVHAVLPTHPVLWQVAQDYPRDGYWFPSRQGDHAPISVGRVSHEISRHFAACGISSGSTHRLRHTYANELRRAGVDMKIIQTLMRHKSLATTEAYFAVDDTELRAAIGTLGA